MEQRIYTAWTDYAGTGEGRTIMAWMGWAESPEEARAKVVSQFGEFFGKGCELHPGIARNEVTEYLWTDAMFKEAKRCMQLRGSYELYTYQHFNFS